ncbi:MAG TPA: VPGUxxT family thioredoxin-like (seleno)protein, type 2 [Phycisphaerae bacterium]|nr:VPGUxxT family thioredoxin-like (seleno)protein, type 2 [Phycisphaerae bacterium]
MGMKHVGINLFVLVLTATAMLPIARADSTSPNVATPIELGRIPWVRNLPKALAASKTSGKPVMLLFDEVPGCGTCKQFGTGPLSHPIVVDAAALFETAVVYNNVPGAEEAILKKYKEPTWNNPVVRFVDSSGKDLMTRHADDYSTGGLLRSMAAALRATKQNVPPYLALVETEYNPGKLETATFAMHCYWEGEQKLGKLDGVVATRIGMLDGLEVVEVDFDSTVLEYAALVRQAKKQDCAHRVFARTDAQVKIARDIVGDMVTRSDTAVDTSTQQQYHLFQKPEYHYLPLTQLQATRVNAMIADGQSPDTLLSPSQLALSKKIAAIHAKNPDLFAKIQPKRNADALPGYWQEMELLIEQAK